MALNIFLRNVLTNTSPAMVFRPSRLLSTSNKVLSSKSDPDCEDKVVMTDDGRVIVCWHPEIPFPYEHTKPMPMDAAPTEAVLKIQSLVPVREVFRQKHERMIIDELKTMTYTTKHRWYPRPRRQRMMELNPNVEDRDREYL